MTFPGVGGVGSEGEGYGVKGSKAKTTQTFIRADLHGMTLSHVTTAYD